jgi:hypothetical protein
MFTKVKERIRTTTQQTRQRTRNRIEQVKMRASHLLIRTVYGDRAGVSGQLLLVEG